MKQKIKYIGMLAILPLFFAGLTVHNEAAAQLTIEEPYVEISSVLVKNKSWYEVKIMIHAGDKDLPAGKLLVTSDTSRKEIDHDKVRANQFTSERITIHADDKASIRADFSKFSTEPFLVIHDVEPAVGEENTYTVTIGVHAGSKDVKDVQVVVTSDISQTRSIGDGTVISQSDIGLEESFTKDLITFYITAMDPNSITANIVSYQFVEPIPQVPFDRRN